MLGLEVGDPLVRLGAAWLGQHATSKGRTPKTVNTVYLTCTLYYTMLEGAMLYIAMHFYTVRNTSPRMLLCRRKLVVRIDWPPDET